MDDPEVLNDLSLQAERGKKTLTQRDKAPFRVTHAGQQARVELDRARFEDLSAHLLDNTIRLTREMLDDARAKGYERFDKIILVGGSTRMPQVRDRISHEFGVEPESFDPDESVAKGAALYGLKEALQDEVKEILAPPTNPRAEGEYGTLDLSAVSEKEVAAALDRIEREIGFTLTGPGPRAGEHEHRERVVEEPGRGGPRRRGAGRGGLYPAAQRRGADGAADRLRDRHAEPGRRGHPGHGGRARQPRPPTTAGTWARRSSTCPRACPREARSA